jgi:hypothetical protein
LLDFVGMIRRSVCDQDVAEKVVAGGAAAQGVTEETYFVAQVDERQAINV